MLNDIAKMVYIYISSKISNISHLLACNPAGTQYNWSSKLGLPQTPGHKSGQSTVTETVRFAQSDNIFYIIHSCLA